MTSEGLDAANLQGILIESPNCVSHPRLQSIQGRLGLRNIGGAPSGRIYVASPGKHPHETQPQIRATTSGTPRAVYRG